MRSHAHLEGVRMSQLFTLGIHIPARATSCLNPQIPLLYSHIPTRDIIAVTSAHCVLELRLERCGFMGPLWVIGGGWRKARHSPCTACLKLALPVSSAACIVPA